LTEQATALNDPFAQSLAGRRLGRYEVLARLAARIRHPNVVPTIDISDTGDAGYYLVMDYIEGDHLGALLQKAYKLGSKLPTPIALRAMVDALEGLAAAHNLTDENGRRINLVHRDVSPHNIMVSTDGIARITDFGVAKAEVRLMSTTRQGQFKGKLAYMAPEHASTGEADQRSDLFSAGIILWESLTGRRLFRAENQAATLNKICIEPIPMPSSVDPELAPFDPILAMALARDPAERFQTAEEFAEAIEQNAEALGGLANQRAVGKLVREYAAEKIDHDRELIRIAVAEIQPVPGEQAVEMPAPARDSVQPGLQAGSAFLAPPITLPEPAAQELDLEQPSSGRRFAWIAVGALVLVAVALAVAAAVMKETPTVTNVQLPPALPTPPPEPTPAPAALAAPVPTLPPVVAQPTPAPTPSAAAQPTPTEPPSPPAPRREETRPRRPSGTGDKPSAKKPSATSPDLLLNPYRK